MPWDFLSRLNLHYLWIQWPQTNASHCGANITYFLPDVFSHPKTLEQVSGEMRSIGSVSNTLPCLIKPLTFRKWVARQCHLSLPPTCVLSLQVCPGVRRAHTGPSCLCSRSSPAVPSTSLPVPAHHTCLAGPLLLLLSSSQIQPTPFQLHITSQVFESCYFMLIRRSFPSQETGTELLPQAKASRQKHPGLCT